MEQIPRMVACDPCSGQAGEGAEHLLDRILNATDDDGVLLDGMGRSSSHDALDVARRRSAQRDRCAR